MNISFAYQVCNETVGLYVYLAHAEASCPGVGGDFENCKM